MALKIVCGQRAEKTHEGKRQKQTEARRVKVKIKTRDGNKNRVCTESRYQHKSQRYRQTEARRGRTSRTIDR